MANALYQALKALDPHTFQLLVVHLLKARYPGVDIKQIEGSAGDQGLDAVSGQLDEHPTIWQCKSFSNGIKASQKQQIRESLKKALKLFAPHRWILCISIDMDTPTLRWFQNLTKSRGAATIIELWQASDIVQHLLCQHTILERFLPGTVLNTAIICESLAGTKAFTTDELAALNEQNVGSYLARLEAHNALFAYRVAFNRDRQPMPSASPGALVSVTKGSTVIEVFARDTDALKVNPPKVTFNVRGAALEKFVEIQRTGRPQEFTAEELIGVKSDFDFLMPEERAGMRLTVTPTAPTKAIPLKVTFGSGEQAVVYEYVLFQRARGGSEEILLESVTKLPFPISLLLGANGTGNVGFAGRCKGHTVKDAHRQARAITIAITTGGIEFYDLANSKRLLWAALNSTVPEWLQHYCNFLNDGVAVVDAYNVNLTVPDVITEEDCRTLGFLYSLLTGATVAAGEITVEFAKRPDVDPKALSAMEGDCAVRLTVLELPAEITMFGSRVKTGPVQYEIARARVREPLAVAQFFREAPIGALMNVVLDAITPITVRKLVGPSQCTLSIHPI